MTVSFTSSNLKTDANALGWRMDTVDPNTDLWVWRDANSNGNIDITSRTAVGVDIACWGMSGLASVPVRTNAFAAQNGQPGNTNLQLNIVPNRATNGGSAFYSQAAGRFTSGGFFTMGVAGTTTYFQPVGNTALAFPNYGLFITNTWIGANTYIIPDSGIRVGALAWNTTTSTIEVAFMNVVNGTLSTTYRNTARFGHETQGLIGGVIANNTSAAISFPSDYRLKHDVTEIMDGLDLIGRLRPIYFNWKSRPDDARVRGFLAHEFQEVFPEAVKGTKDCVKVRRTDPEYQQMDSRKSIPAITSALKQLSRRLDRINTAIGA